MSKPNDLTRDDAIRAMDLYFNRYMVMFSHLTNSYNKFLNEDIKAFLEYGEHVFFEKIAGKEYIKYKFKYSDIKIRPPLMENESEPMFPSDARNRSLSYSGKLLARVKQIQERINTITGEKITKEIGNEEVDFPIAILPIMLRSQYCSLNIHKKTDKSECEYDPGGYFIINGSEKVIISQDKMCENKPLIFTKKDIGFELYIAQINSKSYRPHGIAQTISINQRKDGELYIRAPILSEVNVLILIRALGIESDKDVINYITYDETDSDMIDLLLPTMEGCKTDKGIKIQTQVDALDYLSGKIRVNKKYTESDKITKQQQKIAHLKSLLESGFLPHIKNDMMEKAVFLCYMINKLLRCMLGRIPKDDRDSYVNKRISLPGELIDELFRQFYRKMLNDCNKFFRKRNPSDDEPINIINQIKPNIIEQGLKTALLTGSWIRRKGVAQMLQRLTYLQTLSFLRRIDAPGGDASTNKLTGPRHLHPSSVRWMCLAGDTEITMADKSIKLIKDIKNGDFVCTTENGTFKEMVSSVKNWFVASPEPLFKIITKSGRTIKCTGEHKLLAKTKNDNIYNYVCVSELKPGDCLLVNHTRKYLDNNNYNNKTIKILNTNNVTDYYKPLLSKMGYLNVELPQNVLELSANIIGILSGNNFVSQKHIENLGFNEYGPCMAFINGLRNNVPNKIPEWIILGSQRIMQSFISGLSLESYETDSGINMYIKCDNLYHSDINIILKNFDIVTKSTKNILELGNTVTDIDNLVKYVDLTDNQNKAIICEYVKYIYHTKSVIGFSEFINKYNINSTISLSEIEEIIPITPEPVYDFETVLDTHNFVANSIISSNCTTQTPEHAKVGLTKHLSISGTITILQTSQISVIDGFIRPKLVNIQDLPVGKLKGYTKVFLNGEWLGLTNEPRKIYDELVHNKLHGIFDPTVSIIHDILNREIRAYCDGGRGYAPAICVRNNEIALTKKHIASISLNKADKDKITSWDEFMLKYPGVVEYVDMEEQPYRMFADKISVVEDMRKKMVESVDKVKMVTTKEPENRYDEMMFVKYTHCEFHPAFLLGEISTNVPFCNCNHGPRNIFNYSQSRQAMGIYTSNYRDRLDISYILYHPQRPLVMTKTSKYMNADILPAGENVIVGVACYTGYNQEDSLVFNRSAIQRGLFRSTSLKKHITSIQKNQSTAQDDIFMKPDPSKVTGIRHGSYDKLNDKGYIPEETKIVNGDIIIGKVSPIQPSGNSNKIYKDNSEIYKSHTPGVIDKVYTGIHNTDGYEMMKCRTRSERTPCIGDKFCCYDDATEILTSNGWIKFSDLTMEHQVATMFGDTFKYTLPEEIMTYDYNGKMYVIENGHINYSVTPNHRLYVKYDTENYVIELAENVANYENVHYKKNISSYANTTIYAYYDKWILNYGNKIRQEMKNIGKEHNGRLDNCVWNLSQQYCQKLLDIIFDDARCIKMHNVELADDIQRLCLHAGWSANVYFTNSMTKVYIIKDKANNNPSTSGIWKEYNGKIYCCTVQGEGIIYVRRNGIPMWNGNSRHGQKGTMGLNMKASDIMFSGNGLSPDIILNPNAIPSRMTVGQLVECLMGKVAALEGHDADGTPFNEIDIEQIKDRLEKLGFHRDGIEHMYNGMTGQKLKIQIFIGPTYYHRLKHLVEDKIHSRARGPRTVLTRQAPEGRSREGGLRLGEMERDAYLGHGLSCFLKEKLLDTADAYTTHICNICGLFAQRLYRKDSKRYVTNTDIFHCPACKNSTQISKIMIPYAFKLLLQELMSLNIAPRIRVEQDIYS